MRICGLKLTHDGAIAVIEDGKLLFSTELEKIDNNKRYTAVENTQTIKQILENENISVESIDHFVIDGWGGDDQQALAIQPRLQIGEENNFLSVYDGAALNYIACARYEEISLKDDLLQEYSFNGLSILNKSYPYSSYLHVSGHVFSAYCTSPFAVRNESSYVLIWDGGMYPRLYYFDADSLHVENLGPIFLFIGNVYTIFSQHFGPFKTKGDFAKDDLSVAGKVMAYIALGNLQPQLYSVFEKIYEESYDNPMGFANVFARKFKSSVDLQKYSDEDILLTFHTYLENLLVEKLKKKIDRFKRPSRNLCFAGGCALNIKWNSAIRESRLFQSVYVPPFPNDSGSAIGVACAHMVNKTKKYDLDWNVYSGPWIIQNEPTEEYKTKSFSIQELATLLYSSGEPVVLLNQRAELGPRALGNRSIVASPQSPTIKTILNAIKGREDYRPVSPICLEEDALHIFDPGVSDPFMLFDHQVNLEWKERIPGVLHLDGSARLQTVNHKQNPLVYQLLTEFKKCSGIPMLCNTSANLNGSGFFPDIQSASRWGKVNYIWCDNMLYERTKKIKF